jgi:glycine/D-amino acid oxidase-like deaminating enzyme
MKRRTFLSAALAAPVAARLPAAAAGRGDARTADGLEVAVIGAGAFGGWTALDLVRRGARVTLVDGWGPGNSRASSGGETRVIRAAYSDPIYTRMAQRALALWLENERAFGQRLYHRAGLLFMSGAQGREFVAAATRNLAAQSIAHETLEPDAIARRWPQVAVDGVEQALFEPDAGYLLARRSCAIVADAFVAAGGRHVRKQARPGAVANGKMTSLQLEDGSALAAETFVFACGPWLPTLFPEVLGDLLSATRQEVLYFGTPAGERRYDEGNLPIWADIGERLWYGIPGNEDRGFKIADDSRGAPFDPTAGERKLSEAGLMAARAYLSRRFPGLANAPLVESRVCQYEQTADSNFIVDRHPQAANVWLVGGGSGHGFKHGPALGEHVALRVLDESPEEPKFSLAQHRKAAS